MRRHGKRLSVASLVLSALLMALQVVGCADPEAVLADAEQSRLAGDFEREREVLRRGLEASPEDLPLLLAAARYYLRSEPEGRYKPRLALHYAMRASQASTGSDPEVSRLLYKAYRAAGGLQEGDELVKRGLEAVRHPDATAPKRLRPVDPDLVEPTLENLIEQRRRWREGPPPSPCPPGTGYIPAGRYPVSDTSAREVTAFCIDTLGSGELATKLASASELAAACEAGGRRACSPGEMLVACSAMVTTLGAHPACTMEPIMRCCVAPTRSGN